MASDRFIYWGKEKPTKEQILMIMEDFLGGIGEIDTSDPHRVFVNLPGRGTNPFTRIVCREFFQRDERFIEIFFAKDNIDVMTRQADWFTNSLADTFAKMVARFWGARYQDSEETIDYGK